MCGIVGIVGAQQDAWIDAMNRVQRHRGPDDDGVWRDRDRQLSLAMRRLAIVDINDGHQPFVSDDGSLVLVFNGEIFNAPQLRRELEGRGASFRTHHSDTEVVLNGYATFGEAILDRLNGMFAFVIFDRKRDVLFGARDPAGIKPLYHSSKQGQFAFASELKSLMRVPWLNRAEAELDLVSLSHYLSLQFVPAPRTMWRDVSKLPAGHCLRYSLATGDLRVMRYWRPPHPRPADGRPPDVAGLRTAMADAVRDWLMSDVPVGCSLSGGIDSASVVGIMAELGMPLKTWTLGFREQRPDADERALAAVVARRFKTEHHEIEISADDVLDDLDSMVVALDEPYAGGLPSWYVFKAMSREVKVAMTGTGGDELFGNYDKWKNHTPPRKRWLRRLRWAAREQGIERLLRRPHGALYHGYLGDERKRTLLRNPPDPDDETSRLMESLWVEAGCDDPRDAVARVDFATQLPDEFLHMTDRFSMAWSVEARTPFLDSRLVDLVLRLPAEVRLDARTYKGLMRRVVECWVPEELFLAPKRGFVLPLKDWTRGALRPAVEELLGRRFLAEQGLFASAEVRKRVDEHLLGLRDDTDLVWGLLMFQLWLRSAGTASGADAEVD